MNSEWQQVQVSDLEKAGILLVQDGNHGEYRPRPNEFGIGDTSFIRAADMEDGRVLFDTAGRINDVAVDRIRKGKAKGGDIIFSHKGTVGKIALTPIDSPSFVCSPQTTFWRTLDENQLGRRYLYYFMRSPVFISQWSARKGETDMADYVSLTAQRNLYVVLPPTNEQKAIGGMLGALDDKIELSRQMNHTLEAMAQAIFKSWFVDFDPVTAKAEGRQPYGMNAETAALFPSHFVESDLGPIPEGWSWGVVGDVSENPRRGIRPTDIDPETPYIGLEHMPRRSIALTEWGKAEHVNSGKYRFDTGDILFGKLRPYFHKVGIAAVSGVCSTDVLVVVPKIGMWFGFVLGRVNTIERVRDKREVDKKGENHIKFVEA